MALINDVQFAADSMKIGWEATLKIACFLEVLVPEKRHCMINNFFVSDQRCDHIVFSSLLHILYLFGGVEKWWAETGLLTRSSPCWCSVWWDRLVAFAESIQGLAPASRVECKEKDEHFDLLI